jgi:hypothetical protein
MGASRASGPMQRGRPRVVALGGLSYSQTAAFLFPNGAGFQYERLVHCDARPLTLDSLHDRREEPGGGGTRQARQLKGRQGACCQMTAAERSESARKAAKAR